MSNEALIKKFYDAFAAKDANAMVKCYHKDIVFEDPAFGELKGKEAGMMWRMLLHRGGEFLTVTYKNVEVDGDKGSCEWNADYVFGANRRKVVNHIKAQFEFKDGKIFRHRDHFNMWRWSRQAIGFGGLLFGWSFSMKMKIQRHARANLKVFMEKQGGKKK